MEHVAQRDCGVPFFEIFKNHLDTALDNLLWVSLLEQMDLEVPSNLNHPVIL